MIGGIGPVTTIDSLVTLIGYFLLTPAHSDELVGHGPPNPFRREEAARGFRSDADQTKENANGRITGSYMQRRVPSHDRCEPPLRGRLGQSPASAILISGQYQNTNM